MQALMLPPSGAHAAAVTFFQSTLKPGGLASNSLILNFTNDYSSTATGYVSVVQYSKHIARLLCVISGPTAV